MGYRKAPIFIALGAVVAVILVTAAIDPTGRLATIVGAPAAILLVFGVLAYQWRWTSSQIDAPAGTDAELSPADDLGVVRSQWDMYSILALEPVDPEAMREARRGMFGVVRSSIKLGAVVMILPIATAVILIVYLATGWVPDFGSGKVLVALPVILLPAAMLWVRYTLASAGQSGNEMLRPMGLEITALPKVVVEHSMTGSGHKAATRGSTKMEGSRHGRTVHVAVGEKFVTHLSGIYPEFEVKPDSSDRLYTVGEPGLPALEAALEKLGPSKHWRDLGSIKGSGKGLRASRKVDADGSWMWDLWVSERIADALGQGGVDAEEMGAGGLAGDVRPAG